MFYSQSQPPLHEPYQVISYRPARPGRTDVIFQWKSLTQQILDPNLFWLNLNLKSSSKTSRDAEWMKLASQHSSERDLERHLLLGHPVTRNQLCWKSGLRSTSCIFWWVDLLYDIPSDICIQCNKLRWCAFVGWPTRNFWEVLFFYKVVGICCLIT